MNENLADLHEFNQSRDIQGCKKLALYILRDVKKDAACEQDRIDALRGNKTKLRILRKRALNWIFAERFDKDLQFWCDVYGVRSEAFQNECKKFKKKSRFDKVKKTRRRR